jgi:hypothetical protein
MVQIGLGKYQDSISEKITRATRTGGVVQVVEHLISKCEALNSNLSTRRKNTNENSNIEHQ